MRLVLLIPMLAAILQADPVTVLETRSAFGVTSLSYFYNLPTSTGGVSAQVGASASCYNASTACVGDEPATAIIELTLDLYTPGPIRDGVGYLSLNLGGDGDAGGTPRESGAIGPYSLTFCAKGLSCVLSGYFPFQLGVPFTVDVYALAYGFAPLGGAAANTSASLQLYEVPSQGGGLTGSPVQIFFVPEPSAAILSVTGLSALVLFAAVRRQKPGLCGFCVQRDRSV
jgi:hypothetical protein